MSNNFLCVCVFVRLSAHLFLSSCFSSFVFLRQWHTVACPTTVVYLVWDFTALGDIFLNFDQIFFT